MTREIKFRAWDKAGKTMQAVHSLEMPLLGDIGKVVCDTGKSLRETTRGDVELMQWTGLLDKSGKEIYEGDTLEWSIYEDAQDTEDGEEKEIRIRDYVYFSNGCFALKKRTELLFNKMAPHRKLEIIGNIYENPDLLATPL